MTEATDAGPAPDRRSWGETLALMLDKRVIALAFLGFSSGLPILLVFSSFSVWLSEAGIARAEITFFSWAGLAYGFKYVWAPLVDRLPVPVLTRRFGRRRGWIMLAQLGVVGSLLLTAATDPALAPLTAAVGVICLAFTGATQDIAIDAYRIESAPMDLQPMLAAAYSAGYRIAMILAGAGTLYIASWLQADATAYDVGAWAWSYRIMALAMAIGLVTTWLIPEPPQPAEQAADEIGTTGDQLRFFAVFLCMVAAFIGVFFSLGDSVSALAQDAGPLTQLAAEGVRLAVAVGAAALVAVAMIRVGAARAQHVETAYVAPLRDFFVRNGRAAVVVLLLIGTYRIADIVMGAVANLFYLDLGFTKEDIATYSKVIGVIGSLTGGFLGAIVALRVGIIKALFLGGILAAASNLLFAYLATQEKSELLLAAVIVADNLSGGAAGAAFVAYLSSLTAIRFTATQYALFTSLMLLAPKLLAGYSGTAVDIGGYEAFFIGTAALGVPVLGLIWLTVRLAPPQRS